MSAPTRILASDLEAISLNDVEVAVRAGAARALRARAAVQRKKAGDGTAAAGGQFPDVTIQTGQAAVAARLASVFEALAGEIEAESAR